MPKYEGIIPTMEIIDPNAEPEIPSFAVPMMVKLPLLGEASTLLVAVVAAALVVILLFLLGFLIGRSGRGSYNDDEPPTPPAPRYREEVKAPPKAAPKMAPVERKAAGKPKAEAAPVKAAPKAAPVAEKPKAAEKPLVVDDGISSPFVEDLSSAVQEELHQRREAAEDKPDDFFVDSTYEDDGTDKSVSTMSLQELLDDIHNM